VLEDLGMSASAAGQVRQGMALAWRKTVSQCDQSDQVVFALQFSEPLELNDGVAYQVIPLRMQ